MAARALVLTDRQVGRCILVAALTVALLPRAPDARTDRDQQRGPPAQVVEGQRSQLWHPVEVTAPGRGRGGSGVT